MSVVKKLITSYKSQNQKTKAAPYLLFVLLLLISYFPAVAGIAADPAPLKEITVVSDDNYPPYIFRNGEGHLQGILVDEWRLWEEKTGIKVDLRGMDWDKAKKTMAEGNAQVIDTIFFTEERAITLAFSAPYASLDVPIFFHRDISGIKDVKSLHGFTIGVKAGDACIDYLKRHGIHTLREYPSYESIVRDAAEQKIKVFCIDSPPANYYLYKMNLEQQYRHTAPLYTGQFHRAVAKERKDLLTAVEEGFAKISRKEHEEIEKRWRGSSIARPYLTYLFYLMGGLVILGAILLLWNHTLRRKVTQKTVQLQEAFEALEKSEDKYRTVADFTYDWEYWLAPDGKYIYVSPACERISGYRVEEFHQDPNLLEKIIHPDDKHRLAVHMHDMLQGKSDTCELEFRIITRNNEERWIGHECQGVYGRAGAYLGQRGSNRDITDRKKAAEELKGKDKFLESMIQSSAVATFVVNVEHKVIYWNKACEDLTGIKSEDLLGASDHWKAFYDHPRPCVADLIIDNKFNEMTNLYEVYASSVLIPDGIRAEGWYPNLGGKNRYIVFDAAPIRDNNGKISAAIETLQDITKRKQAEDALQEGQRQLKAILDNIPDIAWLKDKESRFIAVNEPFGKSCGFKPEDLVSKTDLDIWSKDLAERYRADDKEVMESGKRKQVEEPLTDSEGKYLWIETTKTPIYDEHGNFIGTAGIARDITERKRAEAKLRQQTDAMDAAIDGMALLNAEGEYVYLNKAHAKVYGYENAGELIGKSWRILYDSDVIQHFEQEIMPELSRKGDWFGEAIGTKKNGSKFPQELSLTAMADGGLICVVRDITDRKRVEEELQKTLDSLRKAVGATMQVMASAVEARDPYTSGHQIRSADLARAIAMEMGLPQDKIDGIRMAGSIHDIGKLSIPAEILSKPTKLSEIEFSLIKEHARKGYEMLKDVESPWPLAEIVHQHHERMDGSGYPRNLKGDDILIEARILTVADVVEAMASHRPYRPGLGIDAALNEIEKNRGTLYDGAVADACLRLFREKGFNLEGT
jgi:PAS domain S-box-containing protein